mgnify:CR=1 FL=1
MKLSDEEWKKRLTPDQYRVLRNKGTDPRFLCYKCLMELMYALALGAEIHFLLSRRSMNQVPVGLVLLDHYEKTRLNKDQIVLME